MPRRTRSSQSKVLESRSRERREPPSQASRPGAPAGAKRSMWTRPPRANSRILKRLSVKLIDTDQPRRKASNSDRCSWPRNKVSRREKTHPQCARLALQANPCPAHQTPVFHLVESSWAVCQMGGTRHERHRSKTLLKVIFIFQIHMMLQIDSLHWIGS